MTKRIVYFLLLAIIIQPFIFLLIKAFSGIWQYPSVLPEALNFRALNYILRNFQSILDSFGSSLLYSFAVVLTSILISIGPAKIMARNSFRFKTLLETLLMLPLFIPGIVVALGSYPLLLKIGFTDNYAGVILILSITSYPYMLKTLTAGFESYSADLDVTARMLDSPLFNRIRTIHLPQLLPALISGSIIVFLTAFTEYFLVFLIGGGVVKSFSGFLIPYLKSGDWSTASALSLIFILFPLFIYISSEYLMLKFYKKRGIKTGVNL